MPGGVLAVGGVPGRVQGRGPCGQTSHRHEPGPVEGGLETVQGVPRPRGSYGQLPGPVPDRQRRVPHLLHGGGVLVGEEGGGELAGCAGGFEVAVGDEAGDVVAGGLAPVGEGTVDVGR
ncbi:hypothetical protein [Streptomyces sp. rh34]|uniref:hypothetical protein n=1 Tax=Streptomyces sp. rh34 TaxID=2034272 RepID=UPI000BF1FEE6|nr:hypothetical protein [Streptomyces sp. rh34]